MIRKKIERWIRWTESKVEDVAAFSVEPGLGCVDHTGMPVLSNLVHPFEMPDNITQLMTDGSPI